MGIKIIFLDIDGVLNYGRCPERAPSGCIGIDDEKIKLLKEIVDATQAKIVLVSTWKFGWEKDNKSKMLKDCIYMDQKFAGHGLEIYDKTYDHGFDRGHGIIEYLFNTYDYVEKWIVIDDEEFTDYKEYNILPFLIKTGFDEGITEKHVAGAIMALNV